MVTEQQDTMARTMARMQEVAAGEGKAVCSVCADPDCEGCSQEAKDAQIRGSE